MVVVKFELGSNLSDRRPSAVEVQKLEIWQAEFIRASSQICCLKRPHK